MFQISKSSVPHSIPGAISKKKSSVYISPVCFDAAATVILNKRSASAPKAHEPMAQKEAVAALLSMTGVE